MNASKVLYEIAGCPDVEGVRDAEGEQVFCKVCGDQGQDGRKFSRWQGANFTDQNKVDVYGVDWICKICIWAHSWTAPPGYGKFEGRGPNLRTYSHFWDEKDGYNFYKKGDRVSLFSCLERAITEQRKFFCAVAKSGKKHTLPWTHVNDRGASLVRFEKRNAVIRDHFFDLTRWCSTVYSVKGVRLNDIRSGKTYRSRSWMRDPELLMEFERKWSGIRGDVEFDLAVWFCHKDLSFERGELNLKELPKWMIQ